MLDVEKIKRAAEEYSCQELIAALVWQREFNDFDGVEIISDLAQRSDLWDSFLFSKQVFAPDQHGVSFMGLVDTLLAMANYRVMPEGSLIEFVQFPADTLYVLAVNQDVVVTQLLDFGKKWRADSVSVFDGAIAEENWRCRSHIYHSLQKGIWAKDADAIVVTYWWD